MGANLMQKLQLRHRNKNSVYYTPVVTCYIHSIRLYNILYEM